jgi:enoyl-CoA hydratase
MNALSKALRQAIVDVVVALENDPAVRVMILTGAGKAFCAGLDLKELGSDPSALSFSEIGEKDDPIHAIASFSRPVIAAINGPAYTGGFELALACDVLIASSNARFGDTHARVGVLPGWGLSQKLSRTIGIYRAKEASFSGRPISAEKAEQWGLVNNVVAPEDLLPHARALAMDMLAGAPGMLTAYKRVIDDGFALSFQDGLKLERKRARESFVSINADEIVRRRESVQAWGRKRADIPTSDGA